VGTEFKVRWEGYPHEPDSWVTSDAFDGDKLLTDYWRRTRPGKQRGKQRAKAQPLRKVTPKARRTTRSQTKQKRGARRSA
jgi:hypothetical protein